MLAQRLKEYLDHEGVQYTNLTHAKAFTAQEVAESAHVSGRTLAKTVIVNLDGELAMAVLPANRKIIIQDLHDVTGAEQVRFGLLRPDPNDVGVLRGPQRTVKVHRMSADDHERHAMPTEDVEDTKIRCHPRAFPSSG